MMNEAENKSTSKVVIKNPRSLNPGLSVDVDISLNGGEFIPFTAMPGDTAGSDIYHQLISGEHGTIDVCPFKNGLWSEGKWIEEVTENPFEDVEYLKQSLMASTSAKIAPLEDAVDLGMATEDEVAWLKSLKIYRVRLNRVDVSDPVWPEIPDVE